jgi:hypothetical protein
MRGLDCVKLLSSLFLFVPSVLGNPATILCSSRPPQLPDAFSISVKTLTNSSYLGVDRQALIKGSFLPWRSVPDQQYWTILENGTLSTKGSDGTQDFIWEVLSDQANGTSFSHVDLNYNSIIMVGPWIDAPNYKLVKFKMTPACERPGVQIMLNLGDYTSKRFSCMEHLTIDVDSRRIAPDEINSSNLDFYLFHNLRTRNTTGYEAVQFAINTDLPFASAPVSEITVSVGMLRKSSPLLFLARN